MSTTIDPKTSALLVMDFQNSIVQMVDAGRDELLSRTAKLLDGARKAGMRVVYVVVGFRVGYPEVSPRNASFAPIRQSGRFLEGSEDIQVHAAVAAKPGEAIVTKRRVSAFAGTDLEVVLRASGIETLVLAGIATSGVILSTVRHAADADYRMIVVDDCCADRELDVHRLLLDKVISKQATVTKSDEVLAALAR
jgi:nicotinamidase-related amidase